MRNKIQKLLLTSLTLFIFISLFISVPVKAENTLKVGWYEGEEFQEGNDGERYGYSYDYLQEVSYYTGWTYEYVKGSWAELYEMICDGEIDILCGTTYRENRLDRVLYAAKPIGTLGSYIISVNERVDNKISSLKFLDGKIVGLAEGSFQLTIWEAYLNKLGIHATMIPLKCSNKEAASKMKNGEIDVYMTSVLVDEYFDSAFTIRKLSEDDNYVVFNKDKPELKEGFDSAVSKIKQFHPYLQDELRSRYYTPIINSVVTDEQSAWLAAHGPIRVAYLNGDLAEENAISREVTGVLADYLAYAKGSLSNLEIKFETRAYDSVYDMRDALNKGEVDVLFPFVRSLYLGEEFGYMFSSELLSIPMMAITDQSKFNETEVHTVAVLKGDVATKWYLNERYPNWKIVEF
ncbi:MAG: transporter substrate-binding domain-containing protein [Erysipelotrichaceae bacterium]|nr:transporter substrate-binding domain-containing protein [Erysipelotrichaceae bacterium]